MEQMESSKYHWLVIPGLMGLESDFLSLPWYHQCLKQKKFFSLFAQKGQPIPKPWLMYQSLEAVIQEIEQTLLSLPSPRAILGYSLGGRLASLAVQKYPNLVDLALLFSTHSGLLTLEAKQRRLQEDLKLAQKVNNESWLNWMQFWNGQDVFSHTYQFQREPQEVSLLSAALSHWSLGLQPEVKSYFTHQGLYSTYWISGSEDHRAAPAPMNPFWIPAGHRILWDAPERVQKILYYGPKYLEV